MSPSPPPEPVPAAESADAERSGDRLQKVLAQRGLGSRRACEELIADGRVTVNGDVAVLGRRVDIEVDRIEVDGAPLAVRPGLRVLPAEQAARSGHHRSPTRNGRPIVTDFVPAEPRVFPVGRLDADTEGLLMLTNDGDLSHRLTHPCFGVEKEYLAEVAGRPSAAAVRMLREGVELDDGITAPAKVALSPPNLLRITIHEGRNRQVRRMCDAVGHPVRAVGPRPRRPDLGSPAQARNLARAQHGGGPSLGTIRG